MACGRAPSGRKHPLPSAGGGWGEVLRFIGVGNLLRAKTDPTDTGNDMTDSGTHLTNTGTHFPDTGNNIFLCGNDTTNTGTNIP